MKRSTIVTVAVVCTVLVIWLVLFSTPDKNRVKMSNLAGCYLPLEGSQNLKVNITASGVFLYGERVTSVVPYEDKQSLSLLPKLKIVVAPDGQLEFKDGNPLLLRLNSDFYRFTVPSESGEDLIFQKTSC